MARLVVKSYCGTMAAVLLKHLKDRFKNIQQSSVKQPEITKFNTLVMAPRETCCFFVDKIKEQAQKLNNMGNESLIPIYRRKKFIKSIHCWLAICTFKVVKTSKS
jgi:hypothetical protein